MKHLLRSMICMCLIILVISALPKNSHAREPYYTDVEVPLPLFLQASEPWEDKVILGVYPELANPNTETHGDCGCFHSSMAMIMNALQMPGRTMLGEIPDPLMIDRFFYEKKAGHYNSGYTCIGMGYDFSHFKEWVRIIIPKIVDGQVVQNSFNSYYIGLDHDVEAYSESSRDKIYDYLVNKGLPVLLLLDVAPEPDVVTLHNVVIYGYDVSPYTDVGYYLAADPWEGHRPIPDIPEFTDENFLMIHYFDRVQGNDYDWLTVVMKSPAEFSLTDPNGKQVGYNQSIGEVTTDETSTYYISGWNAQDQQSGEHFAKVLTINNPIEGDYILEVVGTGTGPYEVVFDPGGKRFGGLTEPGKVHEYEFYYSEENGASDPPVLATTETIMASPIGHTNAALNANVNSNGWGTNVWFEWNNTSDFSSATNTLKENIGNKGQSQLYSYVVNGLTPNTDYFYRIVSQNKAGVSIGPIVSFTTLPGSDEILAYSEDLTFNSMESRVRSIEPYMNNIFVHEGSNGINLYDSTDGSIISSFPNPGTSSFSEHFTVSGNKLFVGAPAEGAGSIDNTGLAYVFDIESSKSIAQYPNPFTEQGYSKFGMAVAFWGDKPIVFGENFFVVYDSISGESFRVVYDEEMRPVTDNYHPRETERKNYVVFGNNLAISAEQNSLPIVKIYNLESLEEPIVINTPTKANTHGYVNSAIPITMTTVNEDLVVAYRFIPDQVDFHKGYVYFYDSSTLQEKIVLRHPNVVEDLQSNPDVQIHDDYFGTNLRSIGENIMVSSTNINGTKWGDDGSVYFFNGKTGALLWEIKNPYPYSGSERTWAYFGESIAVLNDGRPVVSNYPRSRDLEENRFSKISTFDYCGNGYLSRGEQCDDGNLLDGDYCNSDCSAPYCGNGTVDISEECDDGNTIDGDGCDRNCLVTRCGNGIQDITEECDDGNLVDGDGCSSTCQKLVYYGGGQREDVNKFLGYGQPLVTTTDVLESTFTESVNVIYGDWAIPSSFRAELNGIDITDRFSPDPGSNETVFFDLESGRNVLILTIDGNRSDGRRATDKDRLVFIK